MSVELVCVVIWALAAPLRYCGFVARRVLPATPWGRSERPPTHRMLSRHALAAPCPEALPSGSAGEAQPLVGFLHVLVQLERELEGFNRFGGALELQLCVAIARPTNRRTRIELE